MKRTAVFAIGLISLLAFLSSDHFASLNSAKGSGMITLANGAANPSVSIPDLKAHMEFLAGRCDGRGDCQEGLEKAARYIADRFAEYGLKPMNPSDGYFQYFALIKKKTNLQIESRFGIDNNGIITEFADLQTAIKQVNQKERRPQDLMNGVTYETHLNSASGRAEGSVVFAGYGITRADYDDFSGISAQDKIVCVLRSGPPSPGPSGSGAIATPPDDERIVAKILNAQRHGAKAVIVFSDPKSYDHQKTLHGGRGDSLTEFQPIPFVTAESEEIRIPAICAYHAAVQPLFGGIDLRKIQEAMDAELRPHSFEIPRLRAAIEVRINRETCAVANVVGIIPGSNPVMANQAVIVGAHYDHLGIYPNNVVFPGADDNASGTTAVLAIAKALSLEGKRPGRTVIFVTFAAEEPVGVGAVAGSRYFFDHSRSALPACFTMVNFDMIGKSPAAGRSSPQGRPALAGPAREKIFIAGPSVWPGLKDLCQSANAGLALDLDFENPEDHSSFMSAGDHCPFFLKEIPVISFFDWALEGMHTPRDRVEDIDFFKMARVVELGIRIVKQLSDLVAPPAIDLAEWSAVFDHIRLSSECEY
jgi:hypothetical protein